MRAEIKWKAPVGFFAGWEQAPSRSSSIEPVGLNLGDVAEVEVYWPGGRGGCHVSMHDRGPVSMGDRLWRGWRTPGVLSLAGHFLWAVLFLWL